MKIKKVLLLMLVIATLFSGISIASAATTGKQTWSSTVCKYFFTTAAYVTKPTPNSSTSWTHMIIGVTSGSYGAWQNPMGLYAAPYNVSSGALAGPNTHMSFMDERTVTVYPNHSSVNRLNVRIYNYFGDGKENLESKGYFYGIYK